MTKQQWIITGALVVFGSGLATSVIMQKVNRKPAAQKAADTMAQQNPIVDTYKKQLPELETKYKNNPNDAKVVRDYAVALYATGNIDGAKEKYLAEIKINPNDAVVYNNLGNVYRDENQYDQAVENYQKSIELSTKDNPAYINLANLYLYTLNKPELALKVYQKALNVDPDNANIKINMAVYYEQAKEIDKAKALYREILTKDINNAAAKAGLERLGGASGAKPTVKPTTAAGKMVPTVAK